MPDTSAKPQTLWSSDVGAVVVVAGAVVVVDGALVELELVVDAANIPDEIHISLANLDVGDSLHISAVTLPEGATSAITDRDFTIATIVAPSSLKSSEGDTQTEAEGA